jgi:hypothetical protein
MRNKYPPDSLLLVESPLYRIPEAGVHWFRTYQAHHLERLDIETSTYDPCLLISKQKDKNFRLVGIQTDNTLLISTEKFSRDEQDALQEASFKAKPKTHLSEDSSIEFNGARVILLKDGNITLHQKGQASKIQLIGKEDRTQKYIKQHARSTYLTSICQPKAAYDLAIAAQLQEKDQLKANYKVLNKRLI